VAFAIVAVLWFGAPAVAGGQSLDPLGFPLDAYRFPPDARSQGMAEAYSAVAEGPAATWWNPGALALQEGVWLNPLTRAQLLEEIADDIVFYSFGGTVAIGPVGLGFHMNRIGLGTTEVVDFSGNVVQEIEGSDASYHLGAGTDLLGLFSRGESQARLGVGAAVKVTDRRVALRARYPGGGGEQFSRAATSWDADLGALFRYRWSFRGGRGGPRMMLGIRGAVVAANLRNARRELYQRTDYLDQELRTSVGLEYRGAEMPDLGHALLLLVTAEHRAYFGDGEIATLENDTSTHVGFELTAFFLLTLRGGYVDSVGDVDPIQDWSRGFGLGGDFGLFGWPGKGARFDMTSIPQATGLSRVNQYSVTVWFDF
jgi:hypothetical protein